MRPFFRKNFVAIVIGAAVILSGAFAVWYAAANRAPSFSAVSVKRGNITASLNESGIVRAENNAVLSFQGAGQIAHIYVTEGETVQQGTVIADLMHDSLSANLEQANAALAAAQAKLDGLQSGTRPEQITIDQAAVASAQSSLSATISNAYVSADDAVRNQADNMFTNPRSVSPAFNVPVNDSQLANNIPSSRLAIEGSLTQWYNALSASSTPVSGLTQIAGTVLYQIQSYLNLLAPVVNDAMPNTTLSAAALAGYKANIVTARAEVGAAVTALVNAKSALTSAQNTLLLAQAGATPQDLETQQAVVAQARAAAAAAQAAFNNASLVAPFSGTVQNLTAQVGQVVSPGTPLLSLVNNGGLKIQAYVSEADVAKIKAGDLAQVTLDAFGTDQAFGAMVTTVGTSQTQSNGAPAYLVTLHFTQAAPQVKDGMTGNVRVILAEKDDALEVPSRLVVTDSNQDFVLVQAGGGVVRRPVTVGLVGSDGMTEITSGLTEGEPLANY